MVATWMELAVGAGPERRAQRLDEILGEHLAVQARAPVRLAADSPLLPVVGRADGVSLLQHGFRSRAASEYVHYTVAPLTMLAIDGLLAGQPDHPELRSLLIDVHRGFCAGLREALRRHLDPPEYRRVEGWLRDPATLPIDLVKRGADRLGATLISDLH